MPSSPLLSFNWVQKIKVSVSDIEGEVFKVFVERHHLLLWEGIHTTKQRSLYCAATICRLVSRLLLLKLHLFMNIQECSCINIYPCIFTNPHFTSKTYLPYDYIHFTFIRQHPFKSPCNLYTR